MLNLIERAYSLPSLSPDPYADPASDDRDPSNEMPRSPVMVSMPPPNTHMTGTRGGP